MDRDRQQGVALVITLIFLSVITVMVVALLAVANRGRTASRESSARAEAQRIADIGRTRAEAEIMARALAFTNRDAMGPELMVSVNYVTNDTVVSKQGYANAQWLGNFDQGPPASDILDDDDLQVIANLQFDARPPVFVGPDRALRGETNGFRFFVDLNRNGWFEDTGYFLVLDQNGVPIVDDDGFPLVEYLVGDPQFVGVLQDPNRPHAPDNPFIGRYAYVIQPAGRSLDINQIHNEAKQPVLNMVVNGFRRNEGVGPWEINMAAFLADLNPIWTYENYRLDLDQISGNLSNPGDAFLDASLLLNRRYLPDYSSLRSFDALYPQGSGFVPFDGIDAYAVAPVPLRGMMAFRTNDFDDVVFPWPGAPNNTNFYSLHDYWKGQTPPDYVNFMINLDQVSTNLFDNYDRYTYYRMISQLGNHSVPETPGKINLNYISGFVEENGRWASQTNFLPWTGVYTNPVSGVEVPAADVFFQLTADRLLREEMRGVPLYTNHWVDRSLDIWSQGGIPVTTNGSWVFTNALGGVEKVYSRRVHQLLQMTANIYTATQGGAAGEDYPYYPAVFKPLFYSDGRDLFIRGFSSDVSTSFYNELTGAAVLRPNWVELDKFAVPGTGNLPDNIYFYEVPLIVGARKGFPTFNEFAIQTVVDASRKLELRKDVVDGPITETNMMFILGIQNNFGIETWYPYTNGAPNNFYPRDLEMYVNYGIETVLTNDANVVVAPVYQPVRYLRNIPANTWGGALYTSSTNLFQLPPVTNQVVLPDSVYYLDANSTGQPGFEPVAANNRFEAGVGVFTNRWGLRVAGQMVYYLFDQDPVTGVRHLVDAVTLNGLDVAMDVSDTLNRNEGGDPVLADMWNIEPYDNVNRGVRNQIAVSAGLYSRPSEWMDYGGANVASGNSVNKQIASFRRFLGIAPNSDYPTNDLPAPSLTHQAPFAPMKKIVTTASWQVNDPMVHYTLEDYMDGTNIVQVDVVQGQNPPALALASGFNLGKENTRYDPWGGKNFAAGTTPAANDIDLSLRDPGLWNPDQYEFPTNKFPNLGWLGRVHRGTPWQTIYLKDRPTGVSDWVSNGGLGVDSSMMPTNDWRLLDHFSTALSPDASRGRMSINQTNLAAWSAVLSGIGVTTLSEFGTGQIFADDVFIEPAANDTPVADIVAGIVAAKERMVVATSNQTYTSLGDILAVPQLTTASPYLNPPYIPDSAEAQKYRILRDADYERIPQQVLSLLEVGQPRFVVYTFAQTLAVDQVNPGRTNFKLPINYRVTSETATRTVLRLEYDRISEDPFHPRYGEPDFNEPRIEIESYNLLPLE